MEATEAARGDPSATHPTLSWGPVFAGWFVATAVAATLCAFGLALGLSAFNPDDTAAGAHGIAAGAVVWLILTSGAAVFIGSIFASWFDGRNDTEMGVVRGLAVWGVAVTATGWLISGRLARLMYSAAVSGPAATGVDHAALAHYTAQVMWIVFISAILALVAAVFGGWLGAHHVHRIYHLRTYQPHVRR